ncbi:uncharacterized protein [Epargyreus clarus]|uniref:uncharacterized protein n=1 Tax=Epargyreus clarus TaxID=520877 RepID=UPI003C2AAD30
MDNQVPKLQTGGDIADNWALFIQQFQIYLIANELENKTEKVKVAMLLNAAGPEALRIYNSFKLNDSGKQVTTTERTFQNVVELFEKYFAPQKNIVFSRYQFFKRVQEDGECFDSFQTSIKLLACKCEFGEQLNSLIRDRIVIGVKDVVLQEKLLALGDLSLEKAIQIGRAFEQNKKEKEIMQSDSVSNSLFLVKNDKEKRLKKSKFECYKCGKFHGINECQAYGKTCYKCGKLNHFKNMCAKNNARKWKEDSRNVQEVETSMMSDNVDSLRIEQIQMKNKREDWIHEVYIEEIGNIKFKLDSGADINVLPYHLYQKLNPRKIRLKKNKQKVTTYGGFVIVPVGVISIKCKPMGRNDTIIEFTVVKGDTTPILGRDTCVQLSLIKRVYQVSNNLTEGARKYSKEKTLKYLEILKESKFTMMT